jgi:hypothetical protein
MLVPFISSAEFYKYKDKSGVLRFTDDISVIPKDQRPKVDAYSEPDDFITPELKQQKNEDAEKAQKDAEAKRVIDKDAMRVKLDNTSNALDKEYEELKKTKQDLVDARADAIKNAADTKAHQEKVLQLNEHIKDFQNRRQAFAKEVDAYNKGQGE